MADFRPMSDKQLAFITNLDGINKAYPGEQKEFLSDIATEKKTKVSTRLASKIIDHLKSWNDYCRGPWMASAEEDCDEFDADEKKLIAELKAL